jgi:hypothetical protein
MSQRVRALAVLVLAVALMAGAALASTGDDVGTQNGDHNGGHSDSSSDDGSFLPAPSPVLVLAVVGVAAVLFRRAR